MHLAFQALFTIHHSLGLLPLFLPCCTPHRVSVLFWFSVCGKLLCSLHGASNPCIPRAKKMLRQARAGMVTKNKQANKQTNKLTNKQTNTCGSCTAVIVSTSRASTYLPKLNRAEASLSWHGYKKENRQTNQTNKHTWKLYSNDSRASVIAYTAN